MPSKNLNGLDANGQKVINVGNPTAATDAVNMQSAVIADGTITHIVALTQAAYDALGTPDPTTLYVVT